MGEIEGLGCGLGKGWGAGWGRDWGVREWGGGGMGVGGWRFSQHELVLPMGLVTLTTVSSRSI